VCRVGTAPGGLLSFVINWDIISRGQVDELPPCSHCSSCHLPVGQCLFLLNKRFTDKTSKKKPPTGQNVARQNVKPQWDKRRKKNIEWSKISKGIEKISK
jgi:hypothetical protein